jgi:DNA-binding CsgD family transcriptional regulator
VGGPGHGIGAGYAVNALLIAALSYAVTPQGAGLPAAAIAWVEQWFFLVPDVALFGLAVGLLPGDRGLGRVGRAAVGLVVGFAALVGAGERWPCRSPTTPRCPTRSRSARRHRWPAPWRRASASPSWLSFGPAMAVRIAEWFTGRPQPPAPGPAFAGLTSREHEVLQLIAAGQNNSAIARTLFLSEKTVRNHVSNIFGELQAADRAGAIVRAREAGYGRG